MAQRHRVLIIGGGYGGLYAAKALAGWDVEVTLVDRRNHHLFSPLLYQVATGALAPSDIAQPLRLILRRQENTRVLLAEATEIDPQARTVRLGDGSSLAYDSLIVATGTRHSYFGNDAWAEHAPGIKTLEDALQMRARILDAFENAELETDATRQHAWMTFVIVGGGPTGVELAGALCEIARDVSAARLPPHQYGGSPGLPGGRHRPGATDLSAVPVQGCGTPAGTAGHDDPHAHHGHRHRRRGRDRPGC